MVGSIIGNYKITGKLGQGGMGVVYKADDLRLQRPVAIKFLPPGAMDETARRRFLREARIAAQIHHPHICPIFDVGEVDDQVYFVMAYVEGRTLSQIVSEGPLNLSMSVDLGCQIAQALSQAHRHGIVHRDIKGRNIVVSSDGNASILDFGIALADGSSRLTAEGNWVGTPGYMSPEQATGGEVDHRTDIWSVGILLFEMVTGKLPFERSHQTATLLAIQRDPVPSVRSLRPEAGPDLEHIILKALAKRPEERFQSAAEMAAELQALRNSGAGTNQTTIANVVRPTGRWDGWSRRRLGFLAAAAVILCLAAVLGYLRWRVPATTMERQLAVLPLEVVGNSPDIRVLADGLVETLTAQLTQTEQFQGKVLVVPSSEIRTRKISSAEEARRIYGANLVITGSAQRWGDRLQFTFNLVDAERLRQMGSRSVEFDASNPMALRNGSIDAVVRLLDVQMSAAARQAVTQGDTSTGVAYTEYLKGRGYLARYDQPGNLDRALNSLQMAVEQDPKYALAHSALAEAYWWKALRTNDKHWAGQATANAEKAVQLDSKMAAARVTLARIYVESGRKEDGLRELEQAQQLAPGNAEVLRGLASAYVSLGRTKDAETAYVEATRRRPTDWFGFLLLGVFYQQNGRYEEAERVLLTANGLTPDNEVVRRNLAGVYLRQGRYAAARQQLLAALKIDPSARTYGTLGLAYYYDGRLEEAASALEAAIDLDSSAYSIFGNLGTVYRRMPGNQAKARAAFERAIELAEKGLQVTANDSRIRANLAEYYAKLGQSREALDQVSRIPPADRGRYLDRIVLAYELTGNRAKAIETVGSSSLETSFLQYIRDDPDLKELWKDPTLQRAIQSRRAALKR